MTLFFWPAVITAGLYTVIALDITTGNRAVRALREVLSIPPSEAPKVSIIVAARNEERNIHEALHSILGLDYPNMEVIVVDDRSSDGTGAIVDRIAATALPLKVIHITDLPDGWLGKNHALWSGSGRATGDLLLFSDADIVMEPTVLSRAVRYLQENRLDHLAVTPRMTMPGTFLPMFGLSFIFYFSLFARPWKARDPGSRCHIGIGAFNLVRSEAYRAVGGHETIRLRPDDDMKLGKILKKHGCRSDVAYGPDFLGVEWYASAREAVHGLEKNAFAGCDYRLSLVLPAVIFLLLGSVFPYIAVFVLDGAVRAIYCMVIVLQILLVADCARFHGSRSRNAIGFAPSSLFLSWIILRTAVLNLLRGGICWRGTFYSLKELKRNVV
ncbi:MAG TPA: glycosyltransferase family 2 protein [Geobacteraceae bacterium]|nr:glycosyltransferase family 2 protein [Geobacteraceae bacterium]